jgi:hypothetical protein
MTTHFHLVKLKKEQSYTSTSSLDLHGLFQGADLSFFTLTSIPLFHVFLFVVCYWTYFSYVSCVVSVIDLMVTLPAH